MKEFLEKPWWGGVSGLATIVALLLTLGLVTLKYFDVITISWLGVSIALNTILAITLIFVALRTRKWKRKYEYANNFLESISKKIEKFTKKKRNWLPDPNYMWKLKINDPLLNKLYGKAFGIASNIFQDAKLTRLSIFVKPYDPFDRVSISFDFYSRYADGKWTYSISEVKESYELFSEEVKYDMDRVTFGKLPWLKYPNWPQFLRKSLDKVGTLSSSEETGYYLCVNAWLKQPWSITIKDGSTRKEVSFIYKGKGEPILKD